MLLVASGAVAVLGWAGCSAGRTAVDAGRSEAGAEAGAPPGDDRLFVPEGLPNVNQDGQDVGLVLVAFTLAPGSPGPSFYAAVQNVSSAPLCEAGMMIAFYDLNNQLVGSAASVFQSGHFYALTDGSGAIIPCIAPGQVVHLFPSFNVDVVPAGDLAVTGLEAVSGAGGTTYRGTVANQIGMSASSPEVAVFPLNGVGRPVGMATASATADLAAGSTWTFETSAVDDPGTGQAAFAAGSVP